MPETQLVIITSWLIKPLHLSFFVGVWCTSTFHDLQGSPNPQPLPRKISKSKTAKLPVILWLAQLNLHFHARTVPGAGIVSRSNLEWTQNDDKILAIWPAMGQKTGLERPLSFNVCSGRLKQGAMNHDIMSYSMVLQHTIYVPAQFVRLTIKKR